MLFLVGAANRDDRRYRGRRPVRHPPQRRPAPHVRLRHPLLPRRRARPARGPRRARRGPEAVPGVGRRPSTTPSSPRPRPCAGGRRFRSARRDTRASSTRRRRPYDSPRAPPACGRDARAHHRGGRRAPARLPGLELAGAHGPRRRRAGGRERANGLPALRQRARAARRGDGARSKQEAGVDLEGLALEDIQRLTARILEYVSSFPLEPRTSRRPDAARRAHERQRDALLAAVTPSTAGMVRDRPRRSPRACSTCCGASRPTNASSPTGSSTPKAAITGVTWVIGLVEDAIRRGDRPHA